MVLFFVIHNNFAAGWSAAEIALADTENALADNFYLQNDPLPSKDSAPNTPIEQDVRFFCYNR